MWNCLNSDATEASGKASGQEGGVREAVSVPDSRKPRVFEEARHLRFLSFPPRTLFLVGVQECGYGSAAGVSRQSFPQHEEWDGSRAEEGEESRRWRQAVAFAAREILLKL